MQYGVLICIKCHDFRPNDVRLGLLLYILIPWHLMLAYLIELVAAANARNSRANSKKRDGSTSPTEDESKQFLQSWRMLRILHAVNVTAALAVTSYVVYYYIHHPLIGTLSELHAIIVWLKTASYALTNRDLRHAYLHPVRGERAALPEIYAQCPYPANVTFSNLTYFWWAPTLVYQPAYPRTDRVRWVFVAKRLGEVVCLSAFIWFASAQYATPVLRNSLDKIATLDYMSIVERLLKLSTISLVIWLAGFFALFQSFLNALAEVMRFGDREFYEAWCKSLFFCLLFPLTHSLPPTPQQQSHCQPPIPNLHNKNREQRKPRRVLAHLEQARVPILPAPRLLADAVARVEPPVGQSGRVPALGGPARAAGRRADAQHHRRGLPGHVPAAAADCGHGAV